MTSPIYVTNRRQTASFRIVDLLLTIALPWFLLAAVPGSAHAQTPSLSDWTQFLRDNMQRWNPYETFLGVHSAGSLRFRSRFALAGAYQGSSPAVSNGVIYVCSTNGTLFAFNASTGERLWSNASIAAYQTASVANGMVYVGSADHSVYALNARTGAVIWKYLAGSNTYSATVANGAVYVGSDDEHLYALNAKTGARLWSYATNGPITAAPAVANGIVFAGSGDGYMYALNAGTGVLLWKYLTGPSRYSNIPNGIYSSPAVANGVVYFSGGDVYVYALDAGHGSLIWRYDTGVFSTLSSPAVADGVVYFTSNDGYAHALDASTGIDLWSYAIDPVFGPGLGASPAVANGVVYIGVNITNELYAFGAKTGKLLWSYSNPEFITSDPVIVHGVVYTTAGGPNQSYVYAFSAGADLNLRISPSPMPAHQGDLLTYAFPVWNLGPGNAVHEVLNTQVPAGTAFDYIRISGTPGLGTCTHPPYGGTGQIVCHENGSMAPNTTWTVRLTVRVTAPSGTVISENATAREETADPNLANNTATASVTVQ
jgi:outer membrane protein assembly factor BamB